MMQVKTSGFALASPSTQRAHDDLAALGVADQFAAVRALSGYERLCELAVGEIAGLLAALPPGRPEEFPTEAECAGLLTHVGHRDMPWCGCPVCLAAGGQTDVLASVAEQAAQFAALPVVPVSGTNQDQVMPADGVRLNLSDVVMSRVELVALLNRAALCDPETVAGLSPAEVRKLAVDVLLWEGQHALEEAVDRMSTQPSCGEWDDAYLELCEYQVELAFGLPGREFGFLDRSVSPAEAWRGFTAGYAGARPAPVDVLVHRSAAGVAPVSPSPAGVPIDGEFGPARELVVA